MHRTPVVEGDKVSVRVSGALVPGSAYTLQSVTWAGSPQLSAEDFAKQTPLKAGAVTSQKDLRTTVKLLTDAYQHDGYVYAEVAPTPTVDKTAHTVAYTFTVKPGDQYRVGTVQVNGLPEDRKAQLLKNWKLNPGGLYDPIYVQQFIVKNTALQFFVNYNGRFDTKTDPASHTADVVLNFSPRHVR